MKAKIVLIFSVLLLLLVLSSCSCEHKWSDATCVEPKICADCQATEGDSLGHTWTDATCTTPKTCSVCSETEGEALGHAWINATCYNPKTCSKCSVKEGDVAHTYQNGVCVYCKETKCGVKLDTNYIIVAGDTSLNTAVFTSDSGYIFFRPWISNRDEWTADECIYFKGTPYYALTGIGGPPHIYYQITDTEVLIYDAFDTTKLLQKLSANENGDLVVTYSTDATEIGEIWFRS